MPVVVNNSGSLGGKLIEQATANGIFEQHFFYEINVSTDVLFRQLSVACNNKAKTNYETNHLRN